MKRCVVCAERPALHKSSIYVVDGWDLCRPCFTSFHKDQGKALMIDEWKALLWAARRARRFERRRARR